MGTHVCAATDDVIRFLDKLARVLAQRTARDSVLEAATGELRKVQRAAHATTQAILRRDLLLQPMRNGEWTVVSAFLYTAQRIIGMVALK